MLEAKARYNTRMREYGCKKKIAWSAGMIGCSKCRYYGCRDCRLLISVGLLHCWWLFRCANGICACWFDMTRTFACRSKSAAAAVAGQWRSEHGAPDLTKRKFSPASNQFSFQGSMAEAGRSECGIFPWAWLCAFRGFACARPRCFY